MKNFQVPFIFDPSVYEVYEKYKDSIKEVYFAPDISLTPSGRLTNEHINKSRLCKLCTWCYSNDIDTMMLFNGSNIVYTNEKLAQICDYIADMCLYHLTGVVVANPILGAYLHKKFPDIKIRLSVLSFIDSEIKLKELDQSKIFNGVCLPQHYLRDIDYLKQLKDNTDFELSIIINSGCRQYCALWGWHHNLHNELAATPKCSEIMQSWINLNSQIETNIFKCPWLLPDMLKEYDDIITQFKIEDRSCTAKQLDSYLSYYTGANKLQPLNIVDIVHLSCVNAAYEIPKSPLLVEWKNKILNCKYKCENCNLCERMLNESRSKR